MKRRGTWVCMLAALVVFLGGCDNDKIRSREDFRFESINNEALLPPDEYPALSSVLNNLSGQDLFDTLAAALDVMAAVDRSGAGNRSDYAALLRILENLRDLMRREAAGGEALDTDLLTNIQAVIDIMINADPAYLAPDRDCRIGSLLDASIRRTGAEVLNDEICGILGHLMAADTAILEAVVAGTDLANLAADANAATFEEIMAILGGLLDPQGAYSHVYATVFDYDGSNGILDRLEMVENSGITMAGLRDFLGYLRALDLDDLCTAATEIRIDRALNAAILMLEGRTADLTQADFEGLAGIAGDLLDLADGAGNANLGSLGRAVTTELLTLLADGSASGQQGRADLAQLIEAAGLLLTSVSVPDADGADQPYNPWDTAAMTDLERILYSAVDLADPATLDRAQFSAFVGDALAGLAPVADVATVTGLLTALAQAKYLPHYNPAADGNELGEGLNALLAGNMYGLARTDAATAVRTSTLRALIYMMQAADCAPTAHLLVNLGPMLNMLTSPDGGTVSGTTTNIAQWTIGEVVTAMDSHPAMTPCEAFDWVLYQKSYKMQFAGITLQNLAGLVGMMTNGSVVSLMTGGSYLGVTLSENCTGIIDPFPAFVELAGGDSGLAWTARSGTAGERHGLFALFAPLMEYFWDAGRAGDMVDMLSGLNEIAAYSRLSNADATFKLDNSGTVLKTIEGPYGLGALTYLLRSRTSDDPGLVDPLLDLVCRLTARLAAANDPDDYSRDGYAGTSLLDALVYEGFYCLAQTLDVAGPAEVNLAAAAQQQQLLDGLFGTGDTTGLLDRLSDFLTADSQQAGRSNLEILSAGLAALGDLLLEGSGIDPLLQYVVSEHFWDSLDALWDGGATWDGLAADMDTLEADLRQLLGIAGFDIQDELQTLLGDLADLDGAPAGIAGRPVSLLLRHLLRPQAGSNYNPFVDGIAGLLCKGLNYYDATCNPGATAIRADDPLVDVIISLTAYDLRPAQNLLLALSEKRTASGELLLWAILRDLDTLLGEIVAGEDLSVSLVQSLFLLEPPANRSVVSTLLGILDFTPVCEDTVAMQAVLDELAVLLDGMELSPGSDIYNTLVDVLTFVIDNTHVN